MKSILIFSIFAIILVIGCDELLDPDNNDPIWEGPDYTQSWVGRYHGASDFYDARNGNTHKDRSTTVSIRKSQDNHISVYISIPFGWSDVSFAADGTINSHNSISLQSQSGNNRISISLNRNGNNIRGTARRHHQRTDGSYELIEEATLNCNKE